MVNLANRLVQTKKMVDEGAYFTIQRARQYGKTTFLYGLEIYLRKIYLRPIINGTGNYYIEFRTRNHRRTDLIIDFCGQQTVIELKIWRGNEYHSRGEGQLAEYLDYYHLKKGYMVSFNFNQKKQIGIQEIAFGDKVLVEAVV